MSVRISRTSSTKTSTSSRGSKSSSSPKSSSKTSSSKASDLSKSDKKAISSKTTSLSKSTAKTSNSKASSVLKNVNQVSNITKNLTNNTKSSLKSNVNSCIISAISGAKYIMDAPAIYTSQAMKSTIGSSATALGKNTPKDYVPGGMPSRDYEKYKKSLESKFSGKTSAINKMLENIDTDKSLKLSDDKKTAILVVSEKLLNKGYDAKFVAGVLGNIMNEGTPGVFESSCYKDANKKPPYLVCMQNDFQYDTKYSGKTIGVVGIKETIKLQKQASKKQHTMIVNGEKKLVHDQFGFGMCQFTGDRTSKVLKAYKEFYDNNNKNNHPTQAQCAEIEAGFMVNELESSQFKYIYSDWKKGDKTASSAGSIICFEYEKPHDTENQASIRADNAKKIYNIMKKKN